MNLNFALFILRGISFWMFHKPLTLFLLHVYVMSSFCLLNKLLTNYFSPLHFWKNDHVLENIKRQQGAACGGITFGDMVAT